jgi:cation diffusion facilitator CzcD-associated flavoprotein CzcO
MADGSHLEADAIICATGFDTSFRPGFPVVAFGEDLREAWKEEPTAYMSVAAAGIPNYFSEFSQIAKRKFLSAQANVLNSNSYEWSQLSHQ